MCHSPGQDGHTGPRAPEGGPHLGNQNLQWDGSMGQTTCGTGGAWQATKNHNPPATGRQAAPASCVLRNTDHNSIHLGVHPQVQDKKALHLT